MTIMDEENVKVFPLGWAGIAAKPCDSCKSAAALLFCRPDSAFLCISCDSKVHGANKLSTRHERVWMCEVCEQAPAAVTCKADAAALCVTCDADIHSANPLARRHDRVPVEPFYDSAESLVAKSSSSSAVNNGVNFLVSTNDDDHPNNHLRQEEAEAASWILPNPNAKLAETTDVKTGELCFSDFDHLLEFDYANSIDANFKQNRNYVSDSVVPVQNRAPSAPITNHQTTETCFDIDFCKSKLTPYNYTSGQSLSHSVSSSSMDFGVVPDGSVMSDISYPFAKQINSAGGFDNLGGNLGNQSSQLPGMDREARVLRYREKRKNRKFEKTIRYASRKAYAETRPRIKGRFAKRTEMDLTEVDRMFNPAGVATFVADSGYGVVPSY